MEYVLAVKVYEFHHLYLISTFINFFKVAYKRSDMPLAFSVCNFFFVNDFISVENDRKMSWQKINYTKNNNNKKTTNKNNNKKQQHKTQQQQQKKINKNPNNNKKIWAWSKDQQEQSCCKSNWLRVKSILLW